MIKKLVATFTGASGLFSFSIGKYLNLIPSSFSENQIKKFELSSLGGQKVFFPRTINYFSINKYLEEKEREA